MIEITREQAASILERLAALPETPMRTASVRELLVARSAGDAVGFLEWLVRGALVKEANASLVYASLVAPEDIRAGMPPAKLDELLEVAREAGCVAAMQWLWLPKPASEAELARDHLVDRTLRHLTLGHRRSLARTARGDTAMKLVVDPDPVVITHLLANPATTEAMVLAVASRRPTVAAALEAVLRSPKWTQRYAVRLALVRNPYLEERYAVSLLPCLTKADLATVRDDETLAGTLRLAAQRLLDLWP